MAATENPSKKEVTVPVDRKVRDRDVQRKLQYFGIYNAFANKKLPSNKQIDVALNSALDSDILKKPSSDLSAEGRKLVQDLREVIDQAKVLLLTKNHDEQLQNFIWHSANLDVNASTPNVPVSQSEAQRDGQKAVDGLKTLGTLMITNGQFRKLLSDAGILLQDMVADAGSKAVDKAANLPERIRPDEEARNNLDEPAPDNQWHEKPDVQGLKQQAKDGLDQAKEAARTARSVGQNAAQEAKQGAREGNDNQDSANRAADRAANANDALEKKDELKHDAKQKKAEAQDSTKQYLKEKVPEERRDAAIHRLKKMVVEIQDHEDYNDAIETLLDMAEKYAGHSRKVAEQAGGQVQQAHGSSSNLQKAEAELKSLLENFANATSTDDFFDALDDLYKDADNDREFKNWLSKVDKYIRRCLKETGYILKDESTEEYNKLEKDGRYFLQDKYQEHWDRLMDEVKRFGDAFAQDPENVRFGNAVQHLIDDLGKDKDGKPAFKKHLLKDVGNVILPALFRRIRYVPVPRIEVMDPAVDVVIENLILEGQNIIPNLIEVKNDNFLKYSAYSKIKSKHTHMFEIRLSQIQLDLKDIAYYVHKKQGFPSLKDTGIVDVLISGSGLTVDIGLETADEKAGEHFFKPAKVYVNIHHMDVKLQKSKHKLLFSIFRPLLMSTMRPAIAKAAEKQIASAIRDADAEIYDMYKEAQRLKEKAKRDDPEAAANEAKYYVESLKKRFNRSAEEKKKRASKTKVNVATTADGIQLQKKLPGLTSNLATEMKEKAREGDAWHCPIFSVGSAKETSNLPKPREVKRRSPNKPVDKTGHRQSGSASGYAAGAALGGAGLGGAGLGGAGLGGAGLGGAGAAYGSSAYPTGAYTTTGSSGLNGATAIDSANAGQTGAYEYATTAGQGLTAVHGQSVAGNTVLPSQGADLLPPIIRGQPL
ncbi:hypothetical protein BCR37DRAFT_351059 [Protomyces lactucae-debilis]|uniref:Uncharacterized protein n=1 Tax=Protomyces lactucae-debilis TaxID=2754530 RepID=A0A1Y2F0C4_PROLT|nr:uncharacterized protein BCR37DRAFT_351059 [Protomyces lactucae-debilis]ORY77290.1 hypothetical protein BCR37DRAFT_351059 [Protomyces lactucae-debilis]